MGNIKTIDLTRVTLNLPTSVVEKVKAFAKESGLNITSAYIVLLNKALENNEESLKSSELTTDAIAEVISQLVKNTMDSYYNKNSTERGRKKVEQRK